MFDVRLRMFVHLTIVGMALSSSNLNVVVYIIGLVKANFWGISVFSTLGIIL
jgi:hypothetical protein